MHLSVSVHSKLKGKYRDFPYSLCPHTCILTPIINIPHLYRYISKTDELTLTHHYQPKS